jgi:two-component system chemotaxis response regulator CheY
MAFNVLIVDDSSSMRMMLKKTLEVSGFDIGEFFEAGNGTEALEVLENAWADVILTDVHMPGMDGFDFLKRLKEKDVVSTTPVVVVTTEGREERVDELIQLGAAACIRKPFRPEEIKETLVEALGITENDLVGGGDEADACDF